MSLIPREDWGARKPSGSRNALDPNPKGSGIHWNGPACAASIKTHDKCAGFLRGIQDFHMDTRGWSDIAYSLFVCPHGDVYEGRGKGIGTAAFGTNEGNRYYYAIYAMWGKGDGPVPEKMLDGITEAVAMCRSWGAGSEVIGHRDANKGTECPGDELHKLIHDGRFSKKTSTTKTPTKTSTSDGDRDWSTVLLKEHGKWTTGTIKRLQAEVGVTVDGISGPNTRKAVQKWVGVKQDGIWGPITIKAIQRKVGCGVTGNWSHWTIRAMQRWLNDNRKK